MKKIKQQLEFLREKNVTLLFFSLLMISSMINTAVLGTVVLQMDKKIDLISERVDILKYVELPEEQETPEFNSFEQLSTEANEYYERLGEQVKGTPTWLINGNKYVGFDYQNNLIPGFDISEGFKEIILFSSPTCGFCNKAEDWLKSEGLDYVKVCAPIHEGDYNKCDSTYIK